MKTELSDERPQRVLTRVLTLHRLLYMDTATGQATECDHDYADVSNLMDCDKKRSVYICTDCCDQKVVKW